MLSVFSLLWDRLAGNFLQVINRKSEPVKLYSPLFALFQRLGAIILLSGVLNLRVFKDFTWWKHRFWFCVAYTNFILQLTPAVACDWIFLLKLNHVPLVVFPTFLHICPAIRRGLCDLCLLPMVRRDMENRVYKHPSLCSLTFNSFGERPPAGFLPDLVEVWIFRNLPPYYFVPLLTRHELQFFHDLINTLLPLPPSLSPFCLFPAVIILMDLWNNALLWVWFVFLQLVILSILYLKMFI